MNGISWNGVRRASRVRVGCFALIAASLAAGCRATPGTTRDTSQAAASQTMTRAGERGMSAAAKESWQRLMAGNARFISQEMEHPSQSAQRLHEVAKGQHPFAIILSCSDSRVPPEIVFDTGLGDLFVVRVAGNTADDAAIGSIEYAAQHLGAPLLVVMGHQRCGAVQAALAALNASEPAPGHLDAFIAPIIPAAKRAEQTGGDHVQALAVRENVRQVVEQLTTSKPVLAQMVREHKLAIIGCVYDLDTGHVNIVPQSTTEGAN